MPSMQKITFHDFLDESVPSPFQKNHTTFEIDNFGIEEIKNQYYKIQ